MKKLTFLIFSAVVIFLCALSIWWIASIKPVSSDEELKTFIVTRGTSASLIGKNLKEDGFVKSATAFKFYVQLTGKEKKIQAGEYRLSSGWNLYQVVDQFIKGPTEIWVTIPEGYRKEQIVQRVVNSLGKEGSEAQEFREEFLAFSEDSEGFLFPDTYLFPQDASASAVYKKLRNTFDLKVGQKYSSEAGKTSYSLDDIVTVASLIERETLTESERPVVAGIIYKRIQADWPLQIDAAVQYALASLNCRINYQECDWWPNLTKENMQINSPYNTYKYPDLPPGPICNPGLSSIQSAFYPENSPYWFYLHDPSGQIHFATTLEEHNSNISRYLK